MKAKLLIASLAVAALPVAAHASIASEQAMQVNHGGAQKVSQDQSQGQNLTVPQTRQDLENLNALGKSEAMTQALLFIANRERHTGYQADTQNDAPNVGHRQDW
ncbi:hypothetical protein [Halomonas sp. WWR20]